MGSTGPGRWLRTQTKERTSDVIATDIRAWQRDGLLGAGTVFDCRWSQDGSSIGQMRVRVGPQNATVRYNYCRVDGSVLYCNYTIRLSWTPCHFGGNRPWFLCPVCGHRAALLYGADEFFKCRRCHKLAYASQRMRADDRALQRAQAIRVKLGGSPSIVEPFPSKPKWMRWKTYRGIECEARSAESRSLRKISALLNEGAKHVTHMRSADSIARPEIGE
jgi:hypothetical protein